MYLLKPSESASILFTETGCMINGSDLTPDEIQRLGFLVYAEERGDVTVDQFNLGMVVLCNEIMYRVGLLRRPYKLENMYSHRRTMRFSRN